MTLLFKDSPLSDVSNKLNADRLGMFLSGLCAVHCLIVPVVTISSSYFSTFIDNHYIHAIMLTLLIPISFVAFIKQKRKHQKSTPSILGAIGLLFLVIGIVIGDRIKVSVYTEEILSSLGSLILIAAHALNIKHLKNCSKCTHH